MPFLTEHEIAEIGFLKVGNNVLISDKASIYNAKKISIGNNVRIDDFCVLSAGEGGIEIGNYIHVAVFSSLIGAANIKLGDFCNISSRVSVYSSSDDYSGASMGNPLIPEEYKNVHSSQVRIEEHVIVGSGCVILPGVVLSRGVAVGALSLVNTSCDAYKIYAGIPARIIKDRKMDIEKIGKNFLNSL